jgi:hypothetical protein
MGAGGSSNATLKKTVDDVVMESFYNMATSCEVK